MIKDFIRVKTTIKASVSKVWGVLTSPEAIKEAFWGTELNTTWEVGSPITYSGVWEGVPYEDKGTILEYVPHTLIKMNYWSSMSGTEDILENYSYITYEIEGHDGEVTLHIKQENFNTETQMEHSIESWNTVLKSLKEIAERD